MTPSSFPPGQLMGWCGFPRAENGAGLCRVRASAPWALCSGGSWGGCCGAACSMAVPVLPRGGVPWGTSRAPGALFLRIMLFLLSPYSLSLFIFVV